MDGSKIHLSIKKLGDGASSDTDNDFFGLLRNFLRSHFSAQDTERVMSKFKEVCDRFIIVLGVLASGVISHLKPVEGTNVITGHKCNKGHKCNNICSQM